MTDRVVPFTKTHNVRLSATAMPVLKLLGAASEGRDPVQTYGDLISAAVIASRIIGLDHGQMTEHTRMFVPMVDKALRLRPDIFGGAAND